MPRRCLAFLPACLALSCSSAPEASAPRPPASAPSATSVTSLAKPPRKLNGAPVVLALRRPTPVTGVDWVWLMPEGRLATLAPAGPNGQLAILGPNFFGGPNGLYVGLDVTGELTLAADGAAHAIGKFDHAAFDEKGAHALTWSGSSWAWFERDGHKLRGDEMFSSSPSMLPDGRLVEHVRPQLTRVLSSTGVQAKIPFDCNVIFPAAGRLLCKDPRGAKGTEIVVFGLDGPAELGRFSTAIGRSGRASFTVRGDGAVVARATDTVEVFELASAKKRAASRVAYRRAASTTWMAPRMAFTADGKHLCVEETDGTRILDPGASEFRNSHGLPSIDKRKSTRAACFFASRSEETVGPTAAADGSEWDAVVVNVPLHEGFDPAPTSWSRQRVETAVLSRDRKVGVLAEQHVEGDSSKMRWIDQAVVVDAQTGAEKRIIPLGAYTAARWGGGDLFTMDLSDDGAMLHVCSSQLYQSTCREYDLSTGTQLPKDSWHPAASPTTQFNVWSGEWPDVKTPEVLAAMSVPVEAKAKVVAWSDEGKYVTVEIDPGDGATVRLNMPDTGVHVVRDVVAVAGGSLLALAAQGTVELWRAQPLELLAVLVAVPDGGAALFADGSVEVAGKGEAAVGCQRGEMIFAAAECGDLWAERGTLAALMKAARNSR